MRTKETMLKKKPKTKKQLLQEYDELGRELSRLEGQIDEIATELRDRFDIDVYDV